MVVLVIEYVLLERSVLVLDAVFAVNPEMPVFDHAFEVRPMAVCAVRENAVMLS
jgi:uncharacterized protein (DUF1501 family)